VDLDEVAEVRPTMTMGRKEPANDAGSGVTVTVRPIRPRAESSPPAWTKIAAGVVGGVTAGLVIAQMLRGRRPSRPPMSQNPVRPDVTFAAVGGHDEIKRQIERRIITPFLRPTLYEHFNKKVGGGILMYGPPGCGKTLLARATAGQCSARFYNVGMSDVLDMWLGESERKLAAIFARARATAPSVLFFDELDGLAARQHRESMHSSLVSQFLTELDGFAGNNKGLLVIGATNVPWAIDPAFRRPGRFDRLLFVPPPDRAARSAILGVHMAGRPSAADVNLERIAEHTAGFSGADLALLVEEAVDAAIEASLGRDAPVPVRQEHLQAALRHLRPTTLEWFTAAKDQARLSNEAGQYDEVLRYIAAHAAAKPGNSGREGGSRGQ
jgi:transitional endoplasmic reticulum ATPase